MKKILATLLTLALVISIGASFEPVSAASTPGKVTGVKGSRTSCQITFKWNKAKHAKKYQIYQYKKSKKKFVRIRTTSKRNATIKKLKANTTYKFKIRAINGSRKGKWTKVLTVKTRKPITHSTPVSANGTNFKPGDTYVIKDGTDNVKVTVTEQNNYSGDIEIVGKTSNGSTYIHYQSPQGTLTEIRHPGYISHFDYDDMTSDEFGIGKKLKVKDDNTVVYWTLDGTCPVKGQADLIGYSKWCKLPHSITYYYYELQEYLRATYAVKDGWYPKTKLRGTARKGTTKVWYESHDSTYGNEWYKVYCGSTLIYEFHHNYK